ncbi:MAG: hypothetical protein QNJ68_15085 [Microcoleaceae cyanobacterium MO_207.B10]|nr:hypothetical protein [Microcoleaceae cyanobacterium MO_207.B10]
MVNKYLAFTSAKLEGQLIFSTAIILNPRFTNSVGLKVVYNWLNQQYKSIFSLLYRQTPSYFGILRLLFLQRFQSLI